MLSYNFSGTYASNADRWFSSDQLGLTRQTRRNLMMWGAEETKKTHARLCAV